MPARNCIIGVNPRRLDSQLELRHDLGETSEATENGHSTHMAFAIHLVSYTLHYQLPSVDVPDSGGSQTDSCLVPQTPGGPWFSPVRSEWRDLLPQTQTVAPGQSSMIPRFCSRESTR